MLHGISYNFRRMQHVPSTSSLLPRAPKIPQISIETLQLFAVVFASMLGVHFKTEIDNKETGARVFPPKHRRRLEELLEIFSKLKHPNLIEIYAHVVERTKEAANSVQIIGFTMEYLAKGTLNNYTYKQESERYDNIINPQRTYNWAIQLADVTTYLHSQDFVHTRISPENIFISEDKTTVKICPVCANTNPSDDVTTSDWLNTFGYMAPEVLLDKKYSEKSDVYSFGMVLYALENRRLPFEGKGIKPSSFGEHINHDANRPPLKKDMNLILRDIITQCWKTNPEDRPTMKQVLKLLKDRGRELAGADIPVIRMETVVYLSRLASSSGSMTFKGTIPDHEGSVAIKVLGTRGRIRHIRREVDNLWKINHPNIQRLLVLIKEVDEIQGLIFEYMPKGSVGDYIFGDKDGYEYICTPGRILKWFQQLAKAIVYCHTLEIIHRNIKPNKMLLTDDLESIKLADFSMSRETDESMTIQAGSREYMAPEVIESENYTDKCDVYSFGMTLYACSNTGRKNPFQDEIEEKPMLKTRKMRMFEFLKEGNRPTISIREQLLYLKPLMEKCWQTEANLRPTMEKVDIELAAFEDEPMEH